MAPEMTRSDVRLVALVCGAILGVPLLLCYAFSYALGAAPETPLDAYEDALQRFSYEGFTAHFPPHVPPAATGARLYAFYGFLQAGGAFQLRLTLPLKEVEAVERQWAPRALRDPATGGLYAGTMGGPDDLSAEDDPPRLSERFTVYVLTDPVDPSWPHDANSGVAVRRATGEVVYWAHEW